MEFFSPSEGPSLRLRDRVRTEAFREAIDEVVRPGDVVVDAGAGSGVLALMAARAGARKVYALEGNAGLCETLRRNAAANGLEDVVEAVCGDVRDFRLGRRADVVVAETVETWLIEEPLVAGLNALRANDVIGPKTRLIPSRYRATLRFGHVDFRLYGLAIAFPIHAWDDLREDAGWHPLPFSALSAEIKAFDLDLRERCEESFSLRIRGMATRDGTVNAVQLSGEVALGAERTLRDTPAFNGKKILPVPALDVREGDAVALHLSGRRGSGELTSIRCGLANELVGL